MGGGIGICRYDEAAVMLGWPTNFEQEAFSSDDDDDDDGGGDDDKDDGDDVEGGYDDSGGGGDDDDEEKDCLDHCLDPKDNTDEEGGSGYDRSRAQGIHAAAQAGANT